jgi:hypothetical protein
MTFVAEQTPAQYRLRALHIRRDGEGGVVASFEFALHNADGNTLTHAQWDVTLTSGEQDTLTNFVVSHLSEFETETGLTPLSQSNPNP